MKRKIVAASLALCMIFAAVNFTACGNDGGDKISNNANVLNVKIYSGGYGTEYIYKVKEAFENTFKAEGYTLNVLKPDSKLVSTSVYSDIYSNSGVDVYFTGTIDAEDANNDNLYGKVFTNLEDSVLNTKAIKLDGTEEDVTIKEKIGDRVFNNHIYDGNYYALPYTFGCSGIAVNKKVLDSFNLELPRTTNELFNCADVIMESAENSFSVKPFTYSTGDNTYFSGYVNMWMAQYGGKDEFNEFWSFCKDGGEGEEMGKDSYKVFATDSVKVMYRNFVEMLDFNTQTRGVKTQDFKTAQNQFMQGKCAFYAVGDWLLNEEISRNAQYVNDIVFIKVPVVSELGVKLFGAESAYNKSEEDCDKILTIIIDGVDGNKTKAQIKEDLTAEGFEISDEDIATVCERRGYTLTRTAGGVVISNKSPKKELASKFMRFVCSREVSEIISGCTKTESPFALGCLKDSQYEWVRNVDAVIDNDYLVELKSNPYGYRKKLGLGITILHYAGYMAIDKINNLTTTGDNIISIYDESADFSLKIDSVNDTIKKLKEATYAPTANTLFEGEWNYAKSKLDSGDWKPVV